MFKSRRPDCLSLFSLWVPRLRLLRLWTSRRLGARLSALILGCVLAALMVLLPAAPAMAQTPITWDDLQAHSTQLRNPYEHLSEAQTYRLSSLYKLREWAKVNDPAPESIEAQEIQRLEQTFADEGLDTDALLVHAEEARDYWRSQSNITNPDLEGEAVQLSGYVLPLGENQQRARQSQSVSEFLLVPYVGACIHVPAPSPNQMIYIKPEAAIENPGLFSAVQVTGRLRSQAGSYELFRVDGTQTVTVSYAMDLEAIALDPNRAAPAVSGQISGPWWQNVPARISHVLTVSLSSLSRQISPRTMAAAMLLAFSYGVLHTLGPGHGKAVIVSYFVGNGGSLRRGILMGVRIAVFHVLSAVVIVVLTDRVVQQVSGSSAGSYRVVQLMSYGAIALIGGWMLRQALRPSLHTAAGSANAVSAGSPASSLPNSSLSISAGAEAMLYPSLSQQLSSSENRAPENKLPKNRSQNNNISLASCGCLTCADRQGMGGWLALAVGAVPCSGALLVLLYGLANDLLWPSVAMVIAISVGMAFTLAWIGAIAILSNRYGHQLAARRWQRRSPEQRRQKPRFSLVRAGQLVSASCVLLVGVGLFLLTLTTGTY